MPKNRKKTASSGDREVLGLFVGVHKFRRWIFSGGSIASSALCILCTGWQRQWWRSSATL